jgi:hypothetical protein
MPAKKTTTARKAGQAKKPAKRPTKKAIKKVTRKAAPKRKAAKKTVRKAVKKPAKKTCGCSTPCSTEEAFWVNNGPVLHSLQDLLDALHNMSDEQFEHHTAQGRNDFANWIKECLCDSACATSVKRVRTRVGAVRVLSNKCSC